MTESAKGPVPEVHMLYAMNRKLARYPKFAQASGLGTISDCEGARQFRREYAAYRREHGRFDADEPLGELPPEAPETAAAEPDESSGDVEIQKIYPVVDVPNNAVVQLDFVAPKETHSSWDFDQSRLRCTGTLINKNWVLTAAHCLTFAAVYPCLKAKLSVDDCKARQIGHVWWDNYLAFDISGTRGSTHALWILKGKKVRVYVHPAWLGRNLDENPDFCPGSNCYDVDKGAEHDLGLIYMSQLYDDALQPEIEAQGALRYSTVVPRRDWSYASYGYGEPSDLGAPPLRQGLLTQSTVQNPDRFEIFDNYVKVTLAAGDSALCGGDSGGPLVRTGLSFRTNIGLESNLEAVVGVASGGTPGCDPKQPVTGRDDYWTLVHSPDNLGFIQRVLQSWYPYRAMGSTTRLPAEGGVVEEAWGTDCLNDKRCTDSQVCFHPASFFGSKNCAACGGQGCGCIVGQCAPKR